MSAGETSDTLGPEGRAYVTGQKVVLTTIGSLGDLHPMIAIGLALKRAGMRPVMAVAEDQVERCRTAGLEAASVLPSFGEVARRMGVGEAEAARRIMRDQRTMLEQVILPALSSSAHELSAVAADAAAIVSTIFVLAAPIVAEARGLPLVPVVLQPMAMLSAVDPPHTPDFRVMRHAPVGPAGRTWNRLAYDVMRRVLDLRYGGHVDAVRADFSLRLKGGHRMLEADAASPLILCCYSPEFGPLQRDAPVQARVIGFPNFDHRVDGERTLSPELERFLADGPAPVVFTLGSFAVQAAGSFYAEAAAAARRIGSRAVMLTGSGSATVGGDIFSCDYAPHSLLFHRSSAVVHHGGIGTAGQALRAGRPQLVVPHMGDQYDNAHRMVALGVGQTLSADRFRDRPAATALRGLLTDGKTAERARALASLMPEREPADRAAELITAVLADADGRRS